VSICSRFPNTTATNRREGDAREDMSSELDEMSQLGAQVFILDDNVDHPFCLYHLLCCNPCVTHAVESQMNSRLMYPYSSRLSQKLRCDAAGRRTRDSRDHAEALPVESGGQSDSDGATSGSLDQARVICDVRVSSLKI